MNTKTLHLHRRLAALLAVLLLAAPLAPCAGATETAETMDAAAVDERIDDLFIRKMELLDDYERGYLPKADYEAKIEDIEAELETLGVTQMTPEEVAALSNLGSVDGASSRQKWMVAVAIAAVALVLAVLAVRQRYWR